MHTERNVSHFPAGQEYSLGQGVTLINLESMRTIIMEKESSVAGTLLT